jgi:hypothetical protein
MSGYVPNPPKGYRNSGVEPVDIHAKRWAEYKDLTPKPEDRPSTMGCVFAKSCNLPDGVIDHKSPSGFVPVEKLADYGLWAVLATGSAITAEGTSLQLVGGSAAGGTIAKRLGGSLALELLKASRVVAAGGVVGTIALLMPNTSISPDSAFYKDDQYASLKTGRTRVRVNVKTLPDGSVDAYGFYTGGKTDWENVPVIEAKKDGEKFVADIGNGIGLTWTPAESGDGVMGIPALEGSPQLPPVWVYPPTEQSNKVLVNPEHPPEYQDAIIWFPSTDIQPIYIMLSARYDAGGVTGKGQPVSGIWLAGAGVGEGSPIPSQIADALRGQTFNDFDDFRRAFWLEVSKDPVLRGQFCADNQRKISEGKAPIAIESEHAGERMRFEIHHIVYIKNGGEVYNVDNLAVMTPKRHVETHRENK